MTTDLHPCPKCHTPMRTIERSGIHIETCPDCRGVFLDRGELDRLLDLEAATLARQTPLTTAAASAAPMAAPAPAPVPGPGGVPTPGPSWQQPPPGWAGRRWDRDDDDDDDDDDRRRWGRDDRYERDDRYDRDDRGRRRRGGFLSDLLEGLGD